MMCTTHTHTSTSDAYIVLMATSSCFSLPALLKLPTSSSPRCTRAGVEDTGNGCSSPLPARRHALTSLLLTTAASALPSCIHLRAALAASPFPMMQEPTDLPGFKNTDTGVRIQDVLEGSGAAASEGDLVEFNYVCRRSNGYFVYSTVNQFTGESSPVTLTLGGNKMIVGLQSVLMGMKPGGKRRAVIPPAVGYITTDLEPQPTEFGPQRSLFSHAKEPLLFEVQLLKIK